MEKLYKPENEVELSLIKSIFESEGVQYFVHNEHFGSLKIGPQIDMFNTKMIMVPKNQIPKAKELIADFLGNIQEDESENFRSQYTIKEKIRMVIETILFMWFVPGKRRKKSNKNKEL